jgi:hypothetical protein
MRFFSKPKPFYLSRLLQAVGVLAPALAIYVSLTVLGQLGPIFRWLFDSMFGGKPLPGLTVCVLSMTSNSRIPLHWIGLAVMLVLLFAAYMTARTAPSTESALKRLLLLVSAEWCIAFVFMASTALAMALPLLPLDAWGEKLDMAVMPRFIGAFAKSGTAVIYEGLPHQNLESEQFESEKRSKPTRELHGFFFYKEPVDLSREDQALLQSLIVTTPPFENFRGSKQCFSYHPDFALQWLDAAGHSYDVLICFGCAEAKLYGPGIHLYCDVGGPSYGSLKEMLLKYRKNRPNGTH